MPAIDMKGKKYNHWLVIERAPNNSRGDAMWLCECDCENHTRQIVKGSALRSNHSKSCGCIKSIAAAEVGHNNAANLIGQQFGKLTVIEKAYSRNYKTYWKCKCNCKDNNIVFVPTDRLKSGKTKSCGCNTKNDLTGQIFGKLIALEPTNMRENECIIWKCQCSCPSANIVYVSSDKLKTDQVWNCGCEKQASYGETKIILLLNKYNINFIREKTFSSCKNDETNQNLRFDFFVNNKYLIEFDGEQHFLARETGWFTQQDLLDIQKRDNIKNEWAKNNHIPLIRIPYTHIDNLTIEDLLIESSSFIVK